MTDSDAEGHPCIDAAWAAFFGLSIAEFLLPGIQVVSHQELVGYQGVWVFQHHASLCVSVPPDLVEEVQAAVHAYTVESLFDEAGVRRCGG